MAIVSKILGHSKSLLCLLAMGAFLLAAASAQADSGTTESYETVSAVIQFTGGSPSVVNNSQSPLVGVAQTYLLGASMTTQVVEGDQPPLQQYLWVFLDTSGNDCQDDPNDELADHPNTVVNGQAVTSDGAISPISINYMPTEQDEEKGQVNVCAYVDDAADDPSPSGVQSLVISPTNGQQTLAMSAGSSINAIAGQPFAFSVTAESDSPQNLWVYIDPSGDCGLTPLAEAGQGGVAEDSAAALSGGQTYHLAMPAYTPAANSQPVICAYISDSANDSQPVATQQWTVKVSNPTGTISYILAANKPPRYQPTTISLKGSIDVPSELWVYADSNDPKKTCASTPAAEATENEGFSMVNGLALPAGPYRESFSYTPVANLGSPVVFCSYISPTMNNASFVNGDKPKETSITVGNPLPVPSKWIKSWGKNAGTFEVGQTVGRRKVKAEKGRKVSFSYRWEKFRGKKLILVVGRKDSLKLSPADEGYTIVLVISAKSRHYGATTKTISRGILA